MNPGQQQPVNAPVKIVHHDADENKGGKAHHLPHELEVVVTEGKGHFQLHQAESDVHHAADGGKNQGYHRKGHAAVAQNQQRDHNKGVEDLTAQRHHLLEDVLLVNGDMGLKDADGKGQSGVDGHNAQELFPQGNLIRRQLFSEDDLPVARQEEADAQHQGTQHRIGEKEHPVELGHAGLVVCGLGPGIVADVGAAQTEAQQV